MVANSPAHSNVARLLTPCGFTSPPAKVFRSTTGSKSGMSPSTTQRRAGTAARMYVDALDLNRYAAALTAPPMLAMTNPFAPED